MAGGPKNRRLCKPARPTADGEGHPLFHRPSRRRASWAGPRRATSAWGGMRRCVSWEAWAREVECLGCWGDEGYPTGGAGLAPQSVGFRLVLPTVGSRLARHEVGGEILGSAGQVDKRI